MKKSYLYQVLVLARNNWWCLCVRAAASVGLIVFDILLPMVLADILDQVIYENSRSILFARIPVLFALVAGHIAMMALGVATWGYLESHFMIELRKKTLRHILYMRAERLNQYTTSQLLQILNDDLEQFMQVLIRNISNAIVYSIYCLLLFGALFRVHFKIALVCVMMMFISILLEHFLEKNGRKQKNKYREELGKYKDWVLDHISGMSEIENINIRERVSSEYENGIKGLSFRLSKSNIADQVYSILNDLLSDVLKLLIYSLGAFFVFMNQLSVGEIVVCLSYYGLLSAHVNKLLNIRFDYSVRKVHIQKVFALWDCEQEEWNQGEPLQQIEKVHIEDLKFMYHNGNKWILNECCLRIKKGQMVNIIGLNGRGKSTISYLLYRLYTENEGRILLNDFPIDHYKLSDIRNRIGIVPQKAGFLSGSFRDVLTTGCGADITDDSIWHLIRKVNLYERVRKLPDGFHTWIPDFEREFSMGEIQRMMLVNVLLRNCDIILLDEFTSHIDEENEKAIYHFLFHDLAEKIVINITHKKRLVGENVKTYSLENGRLEEVKSDSIPETVYCEG